ncbi:MAG: hypothetical protein KF784_10650 [Fimbriimonadaceae bacterium]|nr:hypothetical protein [Fimbriimonadaceae bacterium]
MNLGKKYVSALLATLALALGVFALAQTNSKPKPTGSVVLFLSTDCPIAQRYAPRINALYETYVPKGIEFKAYFPNEMETTNRCQTFLSERECEVPFELDLGGARAKAEGVTTVPTIIIFDAKGKKVYQGAIDDSKDPTLVKNHYAKDTLAALAAGKSPKYRKTDVVGCLLMAGEEVPTAESVNYAEHIAPIINKHCMECHRPNEVAPFSLVGYENVRKWSPMLVATTQSKRMPPWKPVEGIGEFHDENRLSEKQIETIKRWHEAGAPRGDAKKEPKTPEFASNWTLGEPDLIVSSKAPYRVEADGADEYRHFVIKTNFTETKWVKAMDVRPGNKTVVHHVIAFLDNTGQSAKNEAKTTDGKEGYAGFGGVGFLPSGALGGWAPGLRPQFTPDGTAFELKPGTTIVLQVHYHRTGKVEMDQTKLGLYFAKEKITSKMQLGWLMNFGLRLPAGEKSIPVDKSFSLPGDVTLHGLMPHMHLLGRSMKATAIYPDGTKEPLIFINDWDFNWQMSYLLKQPKKLPKGTRLLVEAVYDNSASNPRNPNDPPKEVRWGEETTDEMFLLIAAYTVDGEKIGK